MENKKHKSNLSILLLLSLFFINISYAQIGNLLWEDNFNTFNTDIWNVDIGNGCEIGLCGWGNAELEYYRSENLSIESIPGEAGNNALVMEAKRESFTGFEYTSGKVTSEGNLSIHYGMIEIRMQTPPVETGLWPAAWLLGTANVSWPAKGEIDMMEMGHRDEEIANQGHPGTNQDNYVGANAIFANEDGSVGSIAYDVNFNKPYVANNSMANRFMTYRLYWEPTQLRLTVIDNGVENDLYEGPLPLSADSVTSAFQKPFFLLMNLAVGGNFTDAATNGQVTASLPSKLLIDYVKVYEWNGFGTVDFDYAQLTAESGPFGVFTENTPTSNELSFGLDAEIFVWGGTMQNGNTPAFEGNEVIAWETLNPNAWFGGGVASTFGRDMSGYVDEGVLRFNIQVPANLNFRIGVTDNFTNESWIEFPAGENKYGLVRNGNWSQVEIPIVDFAGLIAFQNMNYMFAISSIDGAFPSSSVQIGIDNIVWDDGNEVTTPVTTPTPTPPTGANGNLALNGAAVQSSTTNGGNANRAIDNNTNGNWNQGSITHTAAGVGQWWSVTLDNTYNIGDIAIWNRTNCCSSRLDNITVSVENNVGTVLWSQNITSSSTTTLNVNAGGVAGNVIKITQNQNEPLSLAEVQVFAFEGTPPPTASTFIPDPNKTYYIDVPVHNLRIAANGNSEAAYTTATNTTGADVEWQFVAKGNGSWHIQRAAGGNVPRLRTDNSQFADMQATSSSGTFTYYNFEQGATNGTYFVTLPDGPANFNRLQVNNAGEVKFVSTASNGTWESFTFTEASGTTTGPVSSLIQAEDFTAMSGVQTEGTTDIGGGLNVGYIDFNDWVAYEINVPSSGAYTLNLRTASPNTGANVNLQVNGSNAGNVQIPTTGGWQIWETVSTTVNLNAGTQTLRLTSAGNGYNINWLEIESASAKSISDEALAQILLYPNPVVDQLTVNLGNNNIIDSVEIVGINGQVIYTTSISNNRVITFNTSKLSSGIYLVRIKSGEQTLSIKKLIK